ncbi:hypothetical protein CKF54_06060 [Psittacicella hinzii]|uniref:Phosphohistidine phosphatase SixA n=1 Tax=Psittacicella hinzii TaxID=2028575 RepID=A0A3A1Y0M9_9GAMM|nr:histidine phosphatase family protein [Psittacicella hinzii]RIY31803.1 hypothetical protein CKF54_06060 [Psittacicella hinzii]
MKVIVMRHGEAQGFSAFGGDRNRELTANGIKQAQYAAKLLLNDNSLQVVEVLASDYARAYQTGEQVATINNAKFHPEKYLSISHENLDMVAEKVELLAQEYGDEQAVVLVSHIPIVYDLVNLFLGKSSAFPFHTGSFVVIDLKTKRVVTDINSYE